MNAMKNTNHLPSAFSLRSLVLAAIPSYVFPALMSFLSGYFLQKTELMAASYTTIGLSSLLSTILSFMILWQFELKQILVQNKWVRTLLVILLMVSLGAFCTSIFNLPSECFNITFSAFLGAAIITIRQKVKNYKDEKN
jgi:membrane-bound ClpP family serine protease